MFSIKLISHNFVVSLEHFLHFKTKNMATYTSNHSLGDVVTDPKSEQPSTISAITFKVTANFPSGYPFYELEVPAYVPTPTPASVEEDVDLGG